MAHKEQTLRKLNFEKPEIFHAEFLACGTSVLSTKIPAALAIALACNAPSVTTSIPKAIYH